MVVLRSSQRYKKITRPGWPERFAVICCNSALTVERNISDLHISKLPLPGHSLTLLEDIFTINAPLSTLEWSNV